MSCAGTRQHHHANGKEKKAVIQLLRVRDAMDAKDAGKVEQALDIIQATDLIPTDGDVARIQRRAEEFRDLPDAIQRNLQTFLTLTMDLLATVHQKAKTSMAADVARQMTLAALRKKSRSLMMFAGILKYRMSPDVYSYLARLDVEIAL
ncbi:predicted protein [Postia placenta Mad-698-R]|nr:predicted protein [Postia placenta Mad-698-R]